MREEWTTWWSRKELSLSSLSSLSLLASTEEKKKNKDLWILPNILIRPAAFAGRSRWHWRVVENSSITSYNVEIPDEEKKKKVQEQKKTRSQPSCKAGIKWNVSAEKSKSTEGFLGCFSAAALFFLLLFSRQTPNYAKQLAAAVYARNLLIRYNIYDPLLRESGCCFSFLLYFGLIYSWCVLLLSLLKLIKGREKSKEFFQSSRQARK